jgi:CRP-like cAMP-binding protein
VYLSSFHHAQRNTGLHSQGNLARSLIILSAMEHEMLAQLCLMYSMAVHVRNVFLLLRNGHSNATLLQSMHHRKHLAIDF